MGSAKAGRTIRKAGGAFGAAALGGVQAIKACAPEEKERPVYVTIRVTSDEKARLKRDAAGMSLSAYVRERLLGDEAKPRRSRGKFPVKDHEALAKVLGALGRSYLHSDLTRLANAAAKGKLLLEPANRDALLRACGDVAAMRDDLIAALGLRPSS